MLPAPFVIPPPTARVDKILVCESGGWAKKVAGIKDVPAESVVPVPEFGPDGRPTEALLYVWTRDEWILGSVAGKASVLRMPGKRMLDAWGTEYFRKRGWHVLSIGTARGEQDRRFDDGGNLIVTPPIMPDYPYGRIVVGHGMQKPLKGFFRAQRVQAGPNGRLVEIDTSWLRVGHADEIVSFVPRKDGFSVVLPDPEAGLRLLGSVPSERVLFHDGGKEAASTVQAAGARYIEDTSGILGKGKWKYIRIFSGRGAGQIALVRNIEGNRAVIDRAWLPRGPGPSLAIRYAREGICDSMPIWFQVPDLTSRYVVVENSKMWLDGRGDEFPAVITVGELTADSRLKKLAKTCSDRLYGRGGVLKNLRKALDIPDEQVIRLPVLLSGDEENMNVSSLIPNPTNLVIINNKAIILRPFGPRRDPADDATDIFQESWLDELKQANVRSVILDGWNSLHRSWGGARCGTNTVRTLP
ncbi:protein-arginine deiminase family protein [Planctomycetota bacterium]